MATSNSIVNDCQNLSEHLNKLVTNEESSYFNDSLKLYYKKDKNAKNNENESNIAESPSITILSHNKELRKEPEIPTIVIAGGDELFETSETNNKNQINEYRLSYARRLIGLLSKTISNNSDQDSQKKIIVKFENTNGTDSQTEPCLIENSNQNNTLKEEDNNKNVDSPNSSQVVLRKPLSRTTSLINHLSSNYYYYNQNIINLVNENITRTLNSNETALQKFESIFGPALVSKLVIDNSKNIKDPKTGSNYLSVEKYQTSQSDMSQPTNSSAENELKKKQKIDEYYRIEEKQAKLLKILATNVYRKLNEENTRQNFKLCEPDEMNKIFYVVVELEQLASLVHQQVATQIKERLEHEAEWQEKPYFGDILIQYFHYYKVYRPILQRYPTCQLTLSGLLKKKTFAVYLKTLLDAEAENLENVNRLDMLLDRLVDLPRRSIQLLESYIKLLDQSSMEHSNISKVLQLLTEIFESSNEALNKMSNFQSCYELQYMFEPPRLNIVDPNRQLIKQGPVYKVARRSGELLLRHLALFNDMLLVCKCDKIRRKLIIKYEISANKLTVIQNSNENELMFRLISHDQNNEFKADKPKDKDDWMKAFNKVKEIKKIDIMDKKNYSNETVANMFQIGITPPIWIKDSEQTACSGCKELFTFTRRRHHCRTCGRVYDHNCCSFFVPVKFNDYKEKIRVCRSCFHLLEPIWLEHKMLNETANNSNGNNESNHESSSIDGTTVEPSSTNLNGKLNSINNLLKSFAGISLSHLESKEGNLLNKSNSNSSEINNSNNSESNNSFSKTTGFNNELKERLSQVVLRKSSKIDIDDNESEPSRASSPLNEEQMKIIQQFYDTKTDPDDDDSNFETEDETEESDSIKSSHINDKNDSSPFETTTDSINSNPESKTTNKKWKPVPPAKPSYKSLPLTNTNSLTSNSLINLEKSSSFQLNSNSNSPNKIINGHKKEIIHSEFGYINKIPAKLNEAENEIIENESTNEKDIKPKWDREFLVLNSDYTISVCSSKNNVNNPNFVIQLASFNLENVNDTTFSLKLNEKKTISSRKSITNENGIVENTANVLGLKNKFKMFELNYEIKFSNKDTKNKWFDLLANETQKYCQSK